MITVQARTSLRKLSSRCCRPWVLRTNHDRQYRSQSTYSTLFPSLLISPEELQSSLRLPQDRPGGDIIPLCASWFLPNDPQKRTGASVFRASRIPNARYFDLDVVKDPSSPYPHMLPAARDFAAAMSELGITNDDTVVVYDSAELGIFSAPRVAWTLRSFGHRSVHILNNYRLWVERGFETVSGEPEPVQKTYYERPVMDRPSTAAAYSFVRNHATGKNRERLPHASLLDARPKGRFDGTDPEPRPGLPSGHIPNSINIPFTEVLDPESKAFLPPQRLQEVFEEKLVDPRGPIISSCGTGVTAAILDTALEVAGFPAGSSQTVSPPKGWKETPLPVARFIYDGSWTEWAQRVKPEEGLIETTKK